MGDRCRTIGHLSKVKIQGSVFTHLVRQKGVKEFVGQPFRVSDLEVSKGHREKRYEWWDQIPLRWEITLRPSWRTVKDEGRPGQLGKRCVTGSYKFLRLVQHSTEVTEE